MATIDAITHCVLSPALNGSSEIRCFEIRDGVIFDFYTGLSHNMVFGLTIAHDFLRYRADYQRISEEIVKRKKPPPLPPSDVRSSAAVQKPPIMEGTLARPPPRDRLRTRADTVLVRPPPTLESHDSFDVSRWFLCVCVQWDPVFSPELRSRGVRAYYVD